MHSCGHEQTLWVLGRTLAAPACDADRVKDPARVARGSLSATHVGQLCCFGRVFVDQDFDLGHLRIAAQRMRREWARVPLHKAFGMRPRRT